jgi:hypothetical protein
MLLFRFCRALAKIQALLVFCLGFACRQKPNVLECALALMSVILFIVVVFFTLTGNEQRYVFVADFGARHCQTTMKFEASYNR